MRRRAVVAVLLGLLVLACVLWQQRGTVEERPNRAEATESPTGQPASVATEREAVAERGDAAGEPASIDLRDASQTFRNSTLLFAIRRAGFYCADVVSALESADGIWLASCSDPVGYIVTLRGAEQFDVHAIGYIDSVTPTVAHDSLEPEPLRK